MKTKNIERFYIFNYYLGIFSFFPFIGLFIFSLIVIIIEDIVRLVYPTYSFNFDLISYTHFDSDNSNDNFVFLCLLLFFYSIHLLFFLIPFIRAHSRLKKEFHYRHTFKLLNWSLFGFLSSNLFLFLGLGIFIFNPNGNADGDDFVGLNPLINLVLALGLFFAILYIKFIQRIIYKYFRVYFCLYFILVISPFILMFISKNSFLDLQFYFYLGIIEWTDPLNLSKFLISTLIFSPYNAINLALFFSINHFLITKKLNLTDSNYKICMPQLFEKQKNYLYQKLIEYYLWILLVLLVVSCIILYHNSFNK
jgi:hypothetical protein